MTAEPEFLQNEKPKHDKGASGFITPGTIALIVGMIAIVGVLALQLFRQNQTQPLPGTRAPDFTFTTYDGDVYILKELRGKIVIINFWADWCPPCHAEARDLQNIHEEYVDEGVLMLGINWLDIEADALRFMERYGITYPNGGDLGERITRDYNFEGPPETFVIAPDGRIADVFIGQVSYDRLEQSIVALLPEVTQ